jgi:hypothetical protein
MSPRDGTSERIETWFRVERDGPAPDAILETVVERLRATSQRRQPRSVWVLDRLRFGRRSRAIPVAWIATAVVLGGFALALVLTSPRSDRPGMVAGSPSAPAATAGTIGSPSPTRGPSATPTLPPGALRIDFKVANGLVAQVRTSILAQFAHGTLATPPPHMTASGTFAMSGAFTDAGTFTDAITYAPNGTFTVTRTLETTRGQLVVLATETLFEEAASLTLRGSWRTTGGSGAWTTLTAQGTLSGTCTGPAANLPETWIGSVAS